MVMNEPAWRQAHCPEFCCLVDSNGDACFEGKHATGKDIFYCGHCVLFGEGEEDEDETV